MENSHPSKGFTKKINRQVYWAEDVPKVHVHQNFRTGLCLEVVKMRSYCIKVGPKSNDRCPYKGPWCGHGHRNRHNTETEEGQAKTEAGLGMMQLQPANAKGCRELPGTTGNYRKRARGEKGFFRDPCPLWDLGLPAFRTVRENISAFKPKCVVIRYSYPWGLKFLLIEDFNMKIGKPQMRETIYNVHS